MLNFYLIIIGFIIGVLSGFFGFGGGFILTPLLISMGFPANISVGTSVTQIFISSIIASLKHKRLGNIDAKMSLFIASSSIAGAELGAQVIECLKKAGTENLNLMISLLYIPLLSLTSAYMIYDGIRSRSKKVQEGVYLRKIVRKLKFPPRITPLQIDSEPISIWVILFMGFIIGLSASFLGIGGGVILIPLLIYAVGYKPNIASGTCALEMLLCCAFASFSHIIKGNVNFFLTALILTGSLSGLQIGVLATKYVKVLIFKAAFGFFLATISLSITAKLISEIFNIAALNLVSPIIIFASALATALLILAAVIKEGRKHIKR